MPREDCLVLVEEEVELGLMDPAYFDSVTPFKRPGRFLKPRALSPSADRQITPVRPLIREVVSLGLVPKWPRGILYRGWRPPTPLWREWVWKLRPLYDKVWADAGIFDGVLASTCRIRRDDATILGLLECWCPETNTFVLPWPSGGVEATVTLEDVMILGGFSVLGEPAAYPAGEAGELLEKLVAEHRGATTRRGLRSMSHAEWIDHHMQAAGGRDAGGGGPLEHAAFLALWLSMFVFPGSPGGTIHSGVFPIAARLASGARVALAPAVLASLYRDLRLAKQQAFSHEGAFVAVWAPFHILQLWAWERFESLRPEGTPGFLHWDQPRAARWRCSVVKGRDLSTVRSVLASPTKFRWRPYAASVDGWGCPSFYKQVGRWVTIDTDGDDGGSLLSLLHCLIACELVGFSCSECYNPHRVAMQFGLDQDLPGQIPHGDTSWELTWSGYSRGTKEVKLYVPSQFCTPLATRRFFKWQQEWMSARVVEAEKIALEQVKGVSKGLQLDDESQCFSASTESTRGKTAWKELAAVATAGEHGARMGEGTTSSDESSSACSEKETQNKGNDKPMEAIIVNRDGKAYRGKSSNAVFETSREDHVGDDCEDSANELFVTQELEKVDLPCKSNGSSESSADDALQKEKEKAFDREIEQLKADTNSGTGFHSKFETDKENHVGDDCRRSAYKQFITGRLEKIDLPWESKGKSKRSTCYALQEEEEIDEEIEQLKVQSSRDGEAYSGKRFNLRCEVRIEEIVGDDCGDSAYERFTSQEIEKVDLPRKSKYTGKRRVDDALQKERGFDRKMQKFKTHGDRDGEAYSDNHFNSKIETCKEDHVGNGCGDSVYEWFITEEPEKKDLPCKSKDPGKRSIDNTLQNEKELEREIHNSNAPNKRDREAHSGNQSNSRLETSTQDNMGDDSEDSSCEQVITQDLEKIDLLGKSRCLSKRNVADALHKVKEFEREIQESNVENNSDGEVYSGTQSNSKSTENNLEDHSEDSAYEQFITEELEKIELPCKSKETSKRTVDDALQKVRDREFEREIQKLKAEIAELEEELMKLESETYTASEQRDKDLL